ncbi:hypothetical protein GN156_19445, partial [bacterium LRH843]|nr:hypothetical protein [bacterium LRH843]
GYSFGACVAFEMGLQLEKAGEQVSLVLLDGSHSYVASHTGNYKSRHVDPSQAEADALTYFIMLFKDVDYQKTQKEIQGVKSWDGKVSKAAELLKGATPYSESELAGAAQSFFQKLVAADSYQPSGKYNGHVTLIKAQDNFVNLGEDYGLSPICKRPVQIHSLKGNHRQIVQGDNAVKIAQFLSK